MLIFILYVCIYHGIACSKFYFFSCNVVVYLAYVHYRLFTYSVFLKLQVCLINFSLVQFRSSHIDR